MVERRERELLERLHRVRRERGRDRRDTLHVREPLREPYRREAGAQYFRVQPRGEGDRARVPGVSRDQARAQANGRLSESPLGDTVRTQDGRKGAPAAAAFPVSL